MAARKPKIAAEFEVTTAEVLVVAPTDIVVDHDFNSRPGEERVTEESVADLVPDIRAHGLIQPITVRRLRDGRLAVIDGHRRLTACQIIQRDDPEFRVKANLVTCNDEEAFALSIRANRFRKDVSPVGNALNMRRLVDQYGWDTARVADLYGMEESRVRFLLDVLTLPTAVRRKIADGRLSLNQAADLLRLDERTAVAVVEQAELDVATDPGGRGSQDTRMKAAVHTALRDHGVAKPRTAGDLLKFLGGRADTLSLSLAAYLRGETAAADLAAALDAHEAPACGTAESTATMTAPAENPGPAAQAGRKTKGRKARALKLETTPEPDVTEVLAAEDYADFDPDEDAALMAAAREANAYAASLG